MEQNPQRDERTRPPKTLHSEETSFKVGKAKRKDFSFKQANAQRLQCLQTCTTRNINGSSFRGSIISDGNLDSCKGVGDRNGKYRGEAKNIFFLF